MKKIKEPTIKIQRHLLGSIDLSDIDDKSEMTEQEHRDYCAAIFAIFPRLEQDIKRFLYQQLLFSSNQAENWEQVIFGRGTFNGMSLLLEHWLKASNEHIANSQKREEPDQTKPFAEI